MKAESSKWDCPAPRPVHDVQIEDETVAKLRRHGNLAGIVRYLQFISLEIATSFLNRFARYIREVVKVTTDSHPTLSVKSIDRKFGDYIIPILSSKSSCIRR